MEALIPELPEASFLAAYQATNKDAPPQTEERDLEEPEEATSHVPVRFAALTKSTSQDRRAKRVLKRAAASIVKESLQVCIPHAVFLRSICALSVLF